MHNIHNPTETSTIHMLVKYNSWANKLIFEAVTKLNPGESTKERKTLFKNILNTLNHNYVIALIWQANLEGRQHGITERTTKEFIALDKLWHLQQEIDEWYIRYSNTFCESLNVQVKYTSINGDENIMTREEILLHVVNHTIYHAVSLLMCSIKFQQSH